MLETAVSVAKVKGMHELHEAAPGWGSTHVVFRCDFVLEFGFYRPGRRSTPTLRRASTSARTAPPQCPSQADCLSCAYLLASQSRI